MEKPDAARLLSAIGILQDYGFGETIACSKLKLELTEKFTLPRASSDRNRKVALDMIAGYTKAIREAEEDLEEDTVNKKNKKLKSIIDLSSPGAQSIPTEENKLRQIVEKIGSVEVVSESLVEFSFLKEVTPAFEDESLVTALKNYVGDMLFEQGISDNQSHYITYLQKLRWLNTEVVDSYLELLQKEYSDFTFVHHFHIKKATAEYPTIMEFPTWPKEFRQAEKIFFPIIHGHHWYSMVCERKGMKVYILDSLLSCSNYEPNTQLVAWMLNTYFGISLPIKFVLVNNISQQPDASSCGIYMLKFMQAWAMGFRPMATEQVFAATRRISILLELITGKLADPFNIKEALAHGIGNNSNDCINIEKSEACKKLLILDLNGVLLIPGEGGKCVKGGKGGKRGGKRGGKGRPPMLRAHGNEFLEFCLNHFEVAIWSSKIKNNVTESLSLLDNKLVEKLCFTWNQTDCAVSTLFVDEQPCLEIPLDERSSKPVMFKDLKKVWSSYGKYNSSNTVLVDDSPYKAFPDSAKNAIFPIFDPGDLGYLRKDRELAEYLLKLAEADDVQAFIENDRFGQAPIKPDSPDANFFSLALTKLVPD